MVNLVQSDFNDEVNGLAIIGFIIAIATYSYISQINSYLSKWLFWLVIFLAVICIYLILFGLTHISIKSTKTIFNKAYSGIKKKKDEAGLIQIETRETEDLLIKDFIIDEQSLTKDVESLRNKMRTCRAYKELNHFIPQLKKRLAQAIMLLEQARKSRYSQKLDKEIEERRWEKENLDREIKEKTWRSLLYTDQSERASLYVLGTNNNYIFEKDRLNKRDIEALLKNEYKVYSEYCIIKKKLINVLIKKKLNHSPTHIFLVWNVIKFLRKIKGITNIKEHLSVDADITFNFNSKKYALEIETGNLLKKKKQLQEKVEYNNKRYPKRWMFIVSNRDLVGKFNKWAFSTPRNKVGENVSKMLEISHPI